jgi:CHAT domain-containing protein
MTALLCTVVSPVLAKAPALNSADPSLTSSSAQTQSLVQQGKTLYEAGQFAEAVKVLQQATSAVKAPGDGLSQAMTLSNLSLAYQQLGQWSQAEQAIAESLNLLKTGQNMGTSTERAQILAQALDVQGRLQLVRGQAEAALTTWRQAGSTYAQLGDKAGVTRSRINSAQALQALGLYLQAGKTLTEAQQILQNQPDSPLKATGLRSLGNVFRVVGNLTESRQVLEQSLSVATRSQSPQAISDTLLSLGNTARSQQDTQAAINFYQQAATASASPTTRIQAQVNELSLLLDTEQWPDAQALWPQIQPTIADLPPSRTAVYARINFAQGLTRLRQHTTTDTPSWQDIAQLLAYSVQQAKNLGDRRAISYAQGNLGELYYQTQQWSDAQDLTQQALFIAQAIDASDIAYRWQWQLGRLLRKQGNSQAAIAAYTEAVNNLKSLRSDLVAINPEVQFSFRDEVEPVYRQLVDLLLQESGTSGPSQENLQKARNTIESLQLAELENFFRSACLDAKPEQIDRVVDSDDPRAAVIYPIVLPDRLEVILKLPTQEKLRRYVTNKSQSEVESSLGKLRQYLKEPDRINDVKNLSQQVYDWLIQPLEAELGKTKVRTLVFVLDGALRNIPMAVLYDHKQKQYLIEKYAIALAPGLSLLEPKPLQRERLSALTAGLGEKREVEGREFAPLENVRLELERIESEVPRSEELFNQAFTKTNLQKQINSASFSVVHIATHGKFSSNLEETFILTWDELLKVKDLDNLLRISNQSRSRSIELLVLSACETAAGDKRAALGLAGVAMRAGARSTLATLWQVDDRSTAELMIQFYRELFTNKVTKAEALQRSQVALLTNYRYENYESPYYWAPYVLLGNWF